MIWSRLIRGEHESQSRQLRCSAFEHGSSRGSCHKARAKAWELTRVETGSLQSCLSGSRRALAVGPAKDQDVRPPSRHLSGNQIKTFSAALTTKDHMTRLPSGFDVITQRTLGAESAAVSMYKTHHQTLSLPVRLLGVTARTEGTDDEGKAMLACTPCVPVTIGDQWVNERATHEHTRKWRNCIVCGAPRFVRAEVPKVVVQMLARSELKILIIEDNADAAESLRDVLELSNHRVEIAFDGFEGLRRARAFVPRVVLCDIGLPNMNGYEFASTLRGEEQLKHIYLVAMTGYVKGTDRSHAFAAGFDRHIAKPFRPEELTQLLDEIRSCQRVPTAPASVLGAAGNRVIVGR